MSQEVTEIEQHPRGDEFAQGDSEYLHEGEITTEPLGEPNAPECIEATDTDQFVDWELTPTPVRDARLDVPQQAFRRADRRLFTLALALSVAAHAMTVGAIYWIVGPVRFSPHFVLASPPAAGSSSDLDIANAQTTSVMIPANAMLPPLPDDVKTPRPPLIAPPDPIEDAASTWQVSPSSHLALRDALATQDADPPIPFGFSDNAVSHPFKLPSHFPNAPSPHPIASTQPSQLVQDATPKPAGATNGSSDTARSIAHPPRIAGTGMSEGGKRGAKNGYDSRGLPVPDYPGESKRRGEQGVVVLDVEVNTDGSPGTIAVVKNPGFPRLVEAATEAVREASFEPADIDGKAVTGHIRIPFRFVLQ